MSTAEKFVAGIVAIGIVTAIGLNSRGLGQVASGFGNGANALINASETGKAPRP